ncbi:BPSL0761 family protein [Caballeronia grimmiae]|uniref:BPSL0761 family protein n=1 Tax=Caballeronia grimmiae TaxID=1071679 RepID=UPI0038BCA340
MTSSTERTQAVLATRDFLQLLSNAESVDIPGLVQSVALTLLKHFPMRDDLIASAAVQPELWAAPSDARCTKEETPPAGKCWCCRADGPLNDDKRRSRRVQR